MRLSKVILISLLCSFVLVFSTSAYAQKEVMIAYVNNGGQTLWYPATNETHAIFEKRLAVCNEDLKQFFFLKQLLPKTGIVVVETDFSKGILNFISRESKTSKEIWVMFYGPEDKDFLHISTNFSYDSEQKLVYAPRVDISREWFCSRMIHELGHVNYHVLLHAESATAPMGSSVWISEEVATHEYERIALDYYTNGGYTKILLEILDKYNPSTLKQLFQAIQKEDFERLDSLFMKDASTLERGIRGPAFLINFSTLLAGRLKQDPIDFYREAVSFIRETREK